MPDFNVEKCLLPESLHERNNSRRLRHCRTALSMAIDRRLTPAQQKHVQMYYWDRLRKSDIAEREGTSCSTVSKSIKSAHRQMREYIEMYMNIYDSLEREMLNENND